MYIDFGIKSYRGATGVEPTHHSHTRSTRWLPPPTPTPILRVFGLFLIIHGFASPCNVRHQAIFWTNGSLLLTGPLGTNFWAFDVTTMRKLQEYNANLHPKRTMSTMKLRYKILQGIKFFPMGDLLTLTMIKLLFGENFRKRPQLRQTLRSERGLWIRVVIIVGKISYHEMMVW